MDDDPYNDQKPRRRRPHDWDDDPNNDLDPRPRWRAPSKISKGWWIFIGVVLILVAAWVLGVIKITTEVIKPAAATAAPCVARPCIPCPLVPPTTGAH